MRCNNLSGSSVEKLKLLERFQKRQRLQKKVVAPHNPQQQGVTSYPPTGSGAATRNTTRNTDDTTRNTAES